MKKIIFVSICFVFICLNATKANNDSLLVNNNDSLLIDNCLEMHKSNDSIKKQNTIEIETNNTNKLINRKKLNFRVSKIESLATKPEGFGDFLNNLWDIISSPFKPVWGYYEEDNMRKEGPYFLFMNTDNGNAFIKKLMTDLRIKIQVDGSSERVIYSKVFDQAGTTTIDNCNGVVIPNPNDGSAMCGAAARAKASAFVYLVGLNGTGGSLTNTEREGYRDRI